MKAPVTAIIATLVAIVAFSAGRLSSGKNRDQDPSSPETPGRKASVRSGSQAAGSNRKSDATVRSGNLVADHALTVEEARLLTSEQRMAFLTQGAMSWNSSNQSTLLSGVIAALTKEEIGPATDILGGVQDRGNYQTQEVWDALWTQWGRVDPAKALGFFAKDNSGKSASDARNMMTGWLEADPVAAFAWAKQPKQSNLEAAAAALAITRNANGDPKRMEATILALPADDLTRTACLQDYFDLASMAGEGQGAAVTYDQLSPTLRAAGWPVAIQRLTYQDPQAAARWLESHAGDPGRDYRLAHRLVADLVPSDPAGTMAWAVTLPGLTDDSPSHQIHPAEVAASTWLEIDPIAAQAWLKSHAATVPSVQPMFEKE